MKSKVELAKEIRREVERNGCYVTMGRVTRKYNARGSQGVRLDYRNSKGVTKEWGLDISIEYYKKINVGDSVLFYEIPGISKYVANPSDFLKQKYKNGLFISGKHLDSLEIAQEDSLARENAGAIVIKEKKESDPIYITATPIVIHKASFDGSYLKIVDVMGNQKKFKFCPKYYSNVPDTFLVFFNINSFYEEDSYFVGARKYNTPQIRSMITDYGFYYLGKISPKEDANTRMTKTVDAYRKWIIQNK